MKRFFTIFLLGAALCINAAPVELQYPNCSSELVVENLTIRHKKSSKVIGFIQNNHVYTCFPFQVPPLAEQQVSAFMNSMNGFIRRGGYYFFYEGGSCGFAEPIPPGMSNEEALAKMWNKCQLYRLFPEIERLCTLNVPGDLAMYTVRQYPLEVRTQASLDDIQHKSSRWGNELVSCMPPEDFRFRPIRLKPLDFNDKSVDEDVHKLRQKIDDAITYAGSVDLAMIYCTLGAAKGDAYAQYRLAWLMEEKTEQDPEVILALYQAAVSQGCEEAEPYLARCYWFGIGTASDRRRGFELAEAHLKKNPTSLHARLLTGLWYFYETNEKDKGFSIISECAHDSKFFMPAQLEEALIREFGLGGRPQEVRWASNFNPFPGETVHYWRNGSMLNARDRERWFKCGGGYIP